MVQPSSLPRFLLFSLWLGLSGGWLGLNAVPVWGQSMAIPDSVDRSACPEAVLNRLMSYQVQAGDTLDTVAQQHHLLPATLVGLNPRLQNNSTLQPGQSLWIPPFNGIRVQVRSGQTWEQVANTYKVRADVLFEVNGCQTNVPAEIFVPGVHWFPNVQAFSQDSSQTNAQERVLGGYPLPSLTKIVMNYGWQPHPTEDRLVFNTGIALEAAAMTPVMAVGAGTVAFAGQDQVYGKLVVVNHADGLQTRYAHLNSIQVTIGQTISQGTVLGDVAPYSRGDYGGNNSGDTSFLFFEVRLHTDSGWIAQDPQDYVPKLALY